MKFDQKSKPEAAERFAMLRPYLDGDAPLTKVASDAGIALRTARRWVARVRDGGPAALQRKLRSDAGMRRLADNLVTLIEGLALTKPRLSIATIHRRAGAVAREKGWHAPSYARVHTIVSGLDSAMMTLAHEGEAAFRDRYELVYRHRAERPNARWERVLECPARHSVTTSRPSTVRWVQPLQHRNRQLVITY